MNNITSEELRKNLKHAIHTTFLHFDIRGYREDDKTPYALFRKAFEDAGWKSPEEIEIYNVKQRKDELESHRDWNSPGGIHMTDKELDDYIKRMDEIYKAKPVTFGGKKYDKE